MSRLEVHAHWNVLQPIDGDASSRPALEPRELVVDWNVLQPIDGDESHARERDPVNSPSLKVQRALAARPRTLRTERVVLAIVLVLGTAAAFLVTGAALLRRFFLPAIFLALAVGCAALKADAVALKGDLHAGATVAVGLGEEVVAEAAANPEVVTELATVGADLAQRAGDPTVAADLTAAITPQNVAVRGPKFVAAAKKVQGATAPSAPAPSAPK